MTRRRAGADPVARSGRAALPFLRQASGTHNGRTSPDLLLGNDADPVDRNVLGVAARDPEFARGGIRLRQFGQQLIERVAGRRIHPSWAVPGGVTSPLPADARDSILRDLPEVKMIAANALTWFKRSLEAHAAEARVFGHFPTLFLGMVSPDGGLEHYGGRLRIVDASGGVVADQLSAEACRALINEAVEPWTYVTFPYYAPMGYPNGVYRVGPLARLNVASHCGTAAADAELIAFRQMGQGAVLSSFHYHYARLIEILYCIERIGQILEDPQVLDTDVLAQPARQCVHGLGVSEAPRGTLFHDYTVDENGIITRADLLIATGQNNLAMNLAVLQIAKQFVISTHVSEGALNRVEAGIRAFDPCLSCSAHAVGSMPIHLQVVDVDGTVQQEVRRGP